MREMWQRPFSVLKLRKKRYANSVIMRSCELYDEKWMYGIIILKFVYIVEVLIV